MSNIDTRDLISKREALWADLDFSKENPKDEMALGPQGREVVENELAEINQIEDEVGSEFTYGATMIPVSEFPEYCKEFAEDIGAISGDTRWPATCIDWEKAARELAQDYIEVEYEGTDYYVRAS